MEEDKVDRMDGYEVVGGFDCGGVDMLVVKAAHGTHVMTSEEWETIKKNIIKNNLKSRTKRENVMVA